MEQKNIMVDPTRPDTIRMQAMVKKLTMDGTTGLIRPTIGITIAASTRAVKIRNKNSNTTCGAEEKKNETLRTIVSSHTHTHANCAMAYLPD